MIATPFLLWKDHQTAIGELMSVRDEDGEWYCMGFSEFTRMWKNADVAGDKAQDPNVDFRKWYGSVERGIPSLAAARHGKNEMAGNRLRRLQHLLVDLADELDV
jgi:hypothetical protein